MQRTKNYDYVTTIKGCNIWEDEWNLWLKHGVYHFDTIEVNRLYFDEVDWDLMNQWKEEGRRNAEIAGISLLLFEECPEEILEDFVDLYTEIGNLIPYEDEVKDEEDFLETSTSRRGREEIRKKHGEIWLTAVSKEKDGKISSLTEIVNTPDKTHIANQLLTGVQPRYRGRGLGKWLKAEMLFLVREKIPEVIVIHTGNSKVNNPMLSINERMGFRTVLTVKCFSINIKENPL
ncbi:MAG: GNAT family N-acetyltransferase [Asgard group archaeon]|nr:GNAT family N-acetyltransferase [Asgard group archaeon]